MLSRSVTREQLVYTSLKQIITLRFTCDKRKLNYLKKLTEFLLNYLKVSKYYEHDCRFELEKKLLKK